jgi:diacylglycerol kinase (ATP)
LPGHVRTCVIFNPTARGEKARQLRPYLDEIARKATLKATTSAGDARHLAAEAAREGFEIVVAAGGDGTLNEVLNGLCDAPDALERVRLAVLPLGTVNVFAREIGFPAGLKAAWETILRARESRIDLPCVEYSSSGKVERRYFAQLAGAGLDARAVELVNWRVKKLAGPLAYVLAGCHALLGAPSQITVNGGTRTLTAGLVLIGNGRLYGGPFRIFPQADLRDGLLEVCVFPRADWLTLVRYGPRLLLRGELPASAAEVFQTRTLSLTSASPAPLEVDGEFIGHLPATFSILPSRLRVIVP